MSTEENKQLIGRIIEGTINDRNPAVMDELAAPDYVYHDAASPVHGVAAFKQLAGVFLGAFPDLRLTIEDQIAEGDQVLTRLTIRGTQRGDFMDIPPTGKGVEASALLLSRFRNGKLVEEWERFDTMHFMQQLGVVPAPAEASA